MAYGFKYYSCHIQKNMNMKKLNGIALLKTDPPPCNSSIRKNQPVLNPQIYIDVRFVTIMQIINSFEF